ncbi:unnamed protein product [Nezara viridula]|uniref:Uncharacterized protein n=1 Tax=Nezara viridula TaxID=85310 RepID=A0A9P0E8A4_NEZVI|nr:unnamed protein product [Nezara viridula]CAH1390282.1 unnamed protein product [Nezara viridula]CAH1391398.1 unnamed protein product [Nezara viridula]CAH1391529.1 unnamed protein product [Nezara viridula]
MPPPCPHLNIISTNSFSQ